MTATTAHMNALSKCRMTISPGLPTSIKFHGACETSHRQRPTIGVSVPVLCACASSLQRL
jgi:hypothetical protein